jgi:Ca2+-transporting ATPase
MLVVTVMLGVTLALPFAQRVFRFGPLHASDLAVTVATGVATILILEFLKPSSRERLMT